MHFRHLSNPVLSTTCFFIPSPWQGLTKKFDVVKYVIYIRKEEAAKAAVARASREKMQKFMAVIAQKKEEQLLAKPVEELEAELQAIIASMPTE